MHRFIVAWAITAIALLSPTYSLASDKQTGQQIADALKQSGRLVGFRIGVKYQDGTAWLKGRVSSEEQKSLALEMTRQMPEVSQVVDELSVESAASQPAPVLRPVAHSRLPETSHSASNSPAQPLVAEQPVVHAAKTPRGIAGGLLRIAEPTVDPNVQTTAGELSFPTADSRVASQEQPHLAVQPMVQAASTKRTIIRRRGNPAQQPTMAPTPAAPAAPTATQIAMPNAVNGQGRPMKLIPLVKGPDGRLVPLDPAMAERMGQPMQAPMQQMAPMTRNNSAPAKVLRRGRPMAIASRNQGAHPMQAAYHRMAAGGYGAEQVPAMEGVPGAPLPAHGPAAMGGPAPAYYDQPNMPNYAWPSYAAYPNYAALTYPKQYSPTAWPYIGPFYPYPQVPLGWRKVTLEWDDGWWFLDFDDKNCH